MALNGPRPRPFAAPCQSLRVSGGAGPEPAPISSERLPAVDFRMVGTRT